jgi:hypothetical protein
MDPRVPSVHTAQLPPLLHTRARLANPTLAAIFTCTLVMELKNGQNFPTSALEMRTQMVSHPALLHLTAVDSR